MEIRIQSIEIDKFEDIAVQSFVILDFRSKFASLSPYMHIYLIHSLF